MGTKFALTCRAVLFDNDGVLVDSVASAERGWSTWALEYGLDPAEVLAGVHGRRSADTVAKHLPAPLREGALRRIDELEVADAVSTTAIPGAAELIATLGENWAVVTSATPALLKARLAAAGLPVPRVVVTASDVRHGKPSPEGYLLAAAGLGMAPGDCVVIEDSLTGIRAGRDAGVGHVIGVGPAALATDAQPVVRNLVGLRWSAGVLHIPDLALL
jgi:mannitol-1-/sugar-/sorbitol-6-phosphatase